MHFQSQPAQDCLQSSSFTLLVVRSRRLPSILTSGKATALSKLGRRLSTSCATLVPENARKRDQHQQHHQYHMTRCLSHGDSLVKECVLDLESYPLWKMRHHQLIVAVLAKPKSIISNLAQALRGKTPLGRARCTEAGQSRNLLQKDHPRPAACP